MARVTIESSPNKCVMEFEAEGKVTVKFTPDIDLANKRNNSERFVSNIAAIIVNALTGVTPPNTEISSDEIDNSEL